MGGSALADPLGAHGDVVGDVEFAHVVNTMGTKITKGDLVRIDVDDLNGVGAETTVTVEDRAVLGFAMDDIEAGDHGRVQTYGPFKGANVATGTAIGALLVSSATAGRAAANAAGAFGAIIGWVVGAAAANNKATVFIKKF